MKADKLIDLASSWLEDRNAAYLAKENVIVYYASLTGRKRDHMWHSLSVLEVVRILRSTLLSVENFESLQPRHVIAACQELGRVFEFGMRSRFKVTPNIFNYYDEADMDMADLIMSSLVEEIYSMGYTALLLKDLEDLHTIVSRRLKIPFTMHDRRNLFIKYLTQKGYAVRIESKRVTYKGRKEQAVMMYGKKPSDIVPLSDEDRRIISSKILGLIE